MPLTRNEEINFSPKNGKERTSKKFEKQNPKDMGFEEE
jgi:hypothetical protein